MAETGKVKTQAEFSQGLGISQPLVNQYLKGKAIPGEENVHKIAARLGLEVYDLLGLARPDPIEDELLAAFRRLQEPQKQVVLAYVRTFGAQQK